MLATSAGRTGRYVEFRSLQPIDDLAKNNGYGSLRPSPFQQLPRGLTQRCAAMLTANECLQDAEVCLALAHKTKELRRRAALLEFAYEFRTAAKDLERDERELMVRAASPIHGEYAPR